MIPEISVILPTYNRESLLSFSIGAILNQTISDFELIIVNDGSQDHTSEIIDQYARQDSRIVVVNKPNGGLGSARNAGIERARGIYITFIDDDDSIVPNYLELLLQRDLANFDLVIDSYSNQLDEDAPTPIHFPTRKLTSRQESLQFIFDDLQNVPYCFFAMTKRYRTDIIKKFGIRFSSKIKFVEDRPFVLDYLRYCNSVIVTDTNGYIIKSSREAQYRLSQGVKPADYLCYNILESYLFLCRYAEEMQMDKIREYADNYLIDKVYTYLLIPSATKLHPKSAYNLVLKTFKQYLLGVNQNYIKNKHNLMFINIFINVNPSLAIFLLQCRIKVGKMVRKIVK